MPSPRSARRSWPASLTWSSTTRTRMEWLLLALELVIGGRVAGLVGVATGAVVVGHLRAASLACAFGRLGARRLGLAGLRGVGVHLRVLDLRRLARRVACLRE